ncbi:hypothetical protein [Xanthomonas bundabergensis]|uniref:hypothetical protein n=1 Tax=Xanthomonas bundabergensis TaxID=3160842 RepID=UPI003511B014
MKVDHLDLFRTRLPFLCLGADISKNSNKRKEIFAQRYKVQKQKGVWRILWALDMDKNAFS